eukprot:31095-Chlamydomonas_euryale.AAC.1
MRTCRVAGLIAAGQLKLGPGRPANARSKPGLRRQVTWSVRLADMPVQRAVRQSVPARASFGGA